MKKLYPSAACLCMMLAFWHCQRTPFQPENIQQDYLTFGKGGGMTNQVNTYYILADGHIYQQDNLAKEYQHLGRLKRTARTACFEKAEALPASSWGCEAPGNIYYFLSIHTQDTVKSCTWGSNNFMPSEDITSFYQYTQQLANDL
jgi:hypothetical protein